VGSITKEEREVLTRLLAKEKSDQEERGFQLWVSFLLIFAICPMLWLAGPAIYDNLSNAGKATLLTAWLLGCLCWAMFFWGLIFGGLI